jgi:hypothetical protein
MYWLPGNTLLANKVILKPIWTCGIQLWDSASIFNIEILENFQGKVLFMITDAPWYVPNMILRQDLQVRSGETMTKQEMKANYLLEDLR